MKKEVKKLILFDMDNTLLDADKTHVDAFNKAFKKNNLREVDPERLKKLFGLIRIKIIKILFPGLSKEKIKKIIEDHHKILIKDSKKYIKPFKGVKLTLKKLKKNYKLGVVSNCRHSEILKLLKTAELNHKLFDVIVGDDDVKRPKPYPDEILRAEKIMHLNADYLVGDTTYDMVAGRKAGIKIIGVLTGHHSRSKLKKYKPAYILSNVNEILKILK